MSLVSKTPDLVVGDIGGSPNVLKNARQISFRLNQRLVAFSAELPWSAIRLLLMDLGVPLSDLDRAHNQQHVDAHREGRQYSMVCWHIQSRGLVNLDNPETNRPHTPTCL